MSKAETIGSRLALARHRACLTLTQASQRSMEAPEGRGVSRMAIQGYEKGDVTPGADVIPALAWAYVVDPGWIITGRAGASAASPGTIESPGG